MAGWSFYDAEHFFDGYKDEPEYALATLAGGGASRGGRASCCATPTAAACRARSRRSTAFAGTPARPSPSASTRTTTAGSASPTRIAAVEAGATPDPGHHQRLRRTHRQLQPHQRHPHAPVQDWAADACRPAPWRKLTRAVACSWTRLPTCSHDARQPWVGATAFAHKGGMHVHAVERVARSYEHIDPEAVGNERRVLVSDMSGRTNI